MRTMHFPKSHRQRDRVLDTLRALEAEADLKPAERDGRAAACLDLYLQQKPDNAVVHKGGKLLFAGLDAMQAPLTTRLGALLVPAMERRLPRFAPAAQLAQALNTEALLTRSVVDWGKRAYPLRADDDAAVHDEVAQLMHAQGLNDALAFALADNLSDHDLRAALAYYTSEAGRSFANKLPQLLAAERDANTGPVGLLEPMLGSALRPEDAQENPKLRKLQRILERSPQSNAGPLARKGAVEAAAHLFTDDEVDKALAYWESDAADGINVVLAALQKVIQPRLQHNHYAQRLDEIMRRHCKD